VFDKVSAEMMQLSEALMGLKVWCNVAQCGVVYCGSMLT